MKKSVMALTLLLASTPVLAADLGTANSFNVFVFGNASSPGGHSDGAVAVGGNWTMEYTTTSQALYGQADGKNKIGAYVGGNLQVTNHPSVNNGANVYVGGSYSGGLNLNGGGQAFVGGTNVAASVFSNQQTYSLNQTAAIKALGGEAINTSDLNNLHINAATQSGNRKVYTIDVSQLFQNRTLDVAGLTTTDTLIINVLGTTATGFGLTLNAPDSDYSNILWNFADATSIDISGRALHGSILAPKAAVTQRQNIDGNLIAASWNVMGSVETHFGTKAKFRGSVPFVSDPIPEPAFYQMSGLLLLGGMGIARMRRKRVA